MRPRGASMQARHALVARAEPSRHGRPSVQPCDKLQGLLSDQGWPRMRASEGVAAPQVTKVPVGLVSR